MDHGSFAEGRDGMIAPGRDAIAGSSRRLDCATSHMERIGVRHLQQNAARTLRRVRRGEPIEITDRGRPVALLTPIDYTDTRDALDATGRLSRAEGDLLDLPGPVRVSPGIERPSRRLRKLRATER